MRRLEKTSLLRPLWMRYPARQSLRPGFANTEGEPMSLPSHINPSPLSEISIQQTGGDSHAHIAFNPWKPNQFVIINTLGWLSLFTLLESRQKRKRWELKHGPSAHVGGDATCSEGSTQGNGWATVLWVLDENTLVASTRQSLEIYDVQDDHLNPSQIPKISFSTEPLWVLDLKKSEVKPAYFFVLTSSHVIWLEVLHRPARRHIDGQTVGARVNLSFRHYRSPADRSLCLHVAETDHGKPSASQS